MKYNFFPLFYTFNSRIITFGERVGWILIFPVFLILLTSLFGGDILDFIILFFVTMQVYEVGYLYNDFVTVDKEVNPTIRPCGNRTKIKKNLKKIVLVKLFSAIVILFSFFGSYHGGIASFMLFSILVVYYFHNTVRNRLNIFSYFFLVSLRYLTPVVFLLNLKLFFLVILSFPLIRTLEHATKSKYNLSFLSNLLGHNFDLTRVVYYFFASLFVFSVFGFFYTIPIFYFFALRINAYFLSKTKLFKRNKHEAYK